MPRISVIVPVYNAQPFIDRCVVSILDQSLSDFEVIFVNDCSSDHSAQVIRQFARHDSRIILQQHVENRGPGGARNTGLANARADYLTFVDSDDYLDRNYFERLYETTDGGIFDVVESGFRAVDQKDEVLWDYVPVAAHFTDLNLVEERILLMQEWGVHQKLWRKALFTENGLRFEEGIFWDDIAIVPVLTICARNLAKAEFIGYNYLQRPHSITHTRSAKYIADLFRAYEYFRSFLLKRDIFAPYRNSFVKAIDKTVSYFLEHMKSRNLSNPQLSEKLIRICGVLAEEYAVDNRIFEGIPGAQLEAAIEESMSLDLNQADAQLQSAIRGILETYRVNEQ
jgi:glycosyltransferase involved in cell wall biosynthesis